MNKKPFSVSDYLIWLFKKYHELQQQIQRQNIFRIIHIQTNKNGEPMAKIQVAGKSTIFEASPFEIVSNDELIEGFSKKDIRTLTFYATKESQKPQYRISIQEFCDESKKIIFRLIRRGSKKTLEKTADQISLDKELINQLNPEDAHRVGHVTAMEQALREKEEMERLKAAVARPLS